MQSLLSTGVGDPCGSVADEEDALVAEQLVNRWIVSLRQVVVFDEFQQP